MSLVSVMTPAYKAQGTLARAVRSLQAQTHSDWEMLIISDDGQDYQNILKQNGITDARLRFDSTGQVASGPSRGRNIAIGLARGEYVTTLDADDEYHPEYLATLLAGAKAYEGVSMVLLAHKLKDDGAKQPLMEGSSMTRQLLALPDYIKINGCTVTLFARELLKHRYLETIRHAEDFFFDIRFFAYVKQVPIFSEHLYIYHYNPGSLTSAPRADALFIEDYKKVIAHLEGDTAMESTLRNTLLALYHHRLFQNYLYLNAKSQGECTDFLDFMAKFPQYFQ